MDGTPHNKRHAEQNSPFPLTPVHRHKPENMDYVGITITDDFPGKDLPPLPIVSQRHHQQPPPSHHSSQSQRNSLPAAVPTQIPPIVYHRRRSENFVQQPPLKAASYSSSPSSSYMHRPPPSATQQQPISQQSSSSAQNILQQPYSSSSHHQPFLNSVGQQSQSTNQRSSQPLPQPPPPSNHHHHHHHQPAQPIKAYGSNYSNTSSIQSHSIQNNSGMSSHAKTSQPSIRPSRNEYNSKRGTAFRHVRSKSDMYQPAFRRTNPAKEYYISPLKALTVHLSSTYHRVNPTFRYELSYNPRRVLTKPSKPAKNDGCDNEDSDYILYVNDILGSEEGQKYLILDILGQGTFGQVVKCLNLKTKEVVAVKVVKNKPAYSNQSMMEVAILELLNQSWDSQDEHHILRLRDTFIHKKHLCLVFELLSVNLYELIKQNQFRGLSTNLVRVFTAQLLDALTVLNEARIIHCDLKPENVLLKNLESPTIKVIDFGSACHERQTVYTYIQSRFYRSPEVLFGLPYSSSIDMWSLGCIAVELFLGLPLFPGSSEYNQVARIVEMLGVPPAYMIEVGKTAHEYFERYTNEHGQKKYRLKSMEQYMKEHNSVEQPSKKYFSATKLPDIIQSYPIMRKGLSQKEIDKEMQNRLAFIDFVQGLLNLNPIERWSPQQAKLHPFITGEKFMGKFTPPMQLKNTKSNTSTSQVVPPSTIPQNSSHLAPMSSHKTPNTSPKGSHKKIVISSDNNKGTTTSSQPSGHIVSQRPAAHTSSKSSLTTKNNAGSLNRPRASTIGNVQIPPQIQRAAALVSPGKAPREKDPRRLPQHYPHLQLLPEQDSSEITPFSVVVDGDDRRTNENNNGVLGIRIPDDWYERNDPRPREDRYRRDERSQRDERYQSGTSNDAAIKRGGEGHGTTPNNNEKRLRGDGGLLGSMPGGLPNGGASVSLGDLEDNGSNTVLPLHVSHQPPHQYYQKSSPHGNGHNTNRAWPSPSSSQRQQPSDTYENTQYSLLHPPPNQQSLRHPSPITPVAPRPNLRSSPYYGTSLNSSSYMNNVPVNSHPLPIPPTQSRHQQNLALPVHYHRHSPYSTSNSNQTPSTNHHQSSVQPQHINNHEYNSGRKINTMP